MKARLHVKSREHCSGKPGLIHEYFSLLSVPSYFHADEPISGEDADFKFFLKFIHDVGESCFVIAK